MTRHIYNGAWRSDGGEPTEVGGLGSDHKELDLLRSVNFMLQAVKGQFELKCAPSD